MEFIQKLIYKIECTRLLSRVRELQNSVMAFRVNDSENLQ